MQFFFHMVYYKPTYYFLSSRITSTKVSYSHIICSYCNHYFKRHFVCLKNLAPSCNTHNRVLRCGLAASCMAAEVLKHPNFEEFETDDFFEVALEEGYTKQGTELINRHFLATIYSRLYKYSIISELHVQGCDI